MGGGLGDHSNGPKLLVGQSANITALMCSGTMGPKSSSRVKLTWWLLYTGEEVLHYPTADVNLLSRSFPVQHVFIPPDMLAKVESN